MAILGNRYDFFEDLIYNECISIKNIDFHKDIDLMLVVLNSKEFCKKKFPLLFPGLSHY